MILNAPLFSNLNLLRTYSDYTVELPDSTPSISTNSTPSPGLSELSVPDNREIQPAVSVIRERRTFDLPCAVCGSTATGYHYNVASCNGCKTFFRRCVLSGSTFRCVRNDSKCFSLMPQQDGGARFKCRRCRLDRCLQQGMRREAVTSGLISNDGNRTAPDACLSAISHPSTSAEAIRVEEMASQLRQTLQLINKFRRCNISLGNIDLNINKILAMPSILDNISNYEKVVDFSKFQRQLPEWLTVDLLCAIEFVRKIEDFDNFKEFDKEELIRSSCFTMAIAIEAIESYFDKHTRVVMPDGADVIHQMITANVVIESDYKNMFVGILDPLHREKFSIEELALGLQLLFFTIVEPQNLTPEGQEQFQKSLSSCMNSLIVYLSSRYKNDFSARYGSLNALNGTFAKVTQIHKQKMKEGDPFRQKLQDLLIEQCVFDYRPPKT